jgi:hypothetical protein
MKSFNWILSALAAVTLLLAGCGKTEQPAAVDTAPLQKSFASAEPTVKATVDNTVALIKQGNYPGALQELQKLGANAKLNADQKQAIADVLAKVQKAITSALDKAATGANKALDNVQKSLGK